MEQTHKSEMNRAQAALHTSIASLGLEDEAGTQTVLLHFGGGEKATQNIPLPLASSTPSSSTTTPTLHGLSFEQPQPGNMVEGDSSSSTNRPTSGSEPSSEESSGNIHSDTLVHVSKSDQGTDTVTLTGNEKEKEQNNGRDTQELSHEMQRKQSVGCPLSSFTVTPDAKESTGPRNIRNISTQAEVHPEPTVKEQKSSKTDQGIVPSTDVPPEQNTTGALPKTSTVTAQLHAPPPPVTAEEAPAVQPETTVKEQKASKTDHGKVSSTDVPPERNTSEHAPSPPVTAERAPNSNPQNVPTRDESIISATAVTPAANTGGAQPSTVTVTVHRKVPVTEIDGLKSSCTGVTPLGNTGGGAGQPSIASQKVLHQSPVTQQKPPSGEGIMSTPPVTRNPTAHTGPNAAVPNLAPDVPNPEHLPGHPAPPLPKSTVQSLVSSTPVTPEMKTPSSGTPPPADIVTEKCALLVTNADAGNTTPPRTDTHSDILDPETAKSPVTKKLEPAAHPPTAHPPTARSDSQVAQGKISDALNEAPNDPTVRAERKSEANNTRNADADTGTSGVMKSGQLVNTESTHEEKSGTCHDRVIGTIQVYRYPESNDTEESSAESLTDYPPPDYSSLGEPSQPLSEKMRAFNLAQLLVQNPQLMDHVQSLSPTILQGVNLTQTNDIGGPTLSSDMFADASEDISREEACTIKEALPTSLNVTPSLKLGQPHARAAAQSFGNTSGSNVYGGDTEDASTQYGSDRGTLNQSDVSNLATDGGRDEASMTCDTDDASTLDVQGSDKVSIMGTDGCGDDECGEDLSKTGDASHDADISQTASESEPHKVCSDNVSNKVPIKVVLPAEVKTEGNECKEPVPVQLIPVQVQKSTQALSHKAQLKAEKKGLQLPIGAELRHGYIEPGVGELAGSQSGENFIIQAKEMKGHKIEISDTPVPSTSQVAPVKKTKRVEWPDTIIFADQATGKTIGSIMIPPTDIDETPGIKTGKLTDYTAGRIDDIQVDTTRGVAEFFDMLRSQDKTVTSTVEKRIQVSRPTRTCSVGTHLDYVGDMVKHTMNINIRYMSDMLRHAPLQQEVIDRFESGEQELSQGDKSGNVFEEGDLLLTVTRKKEECGKKPSDAAYEEKEGNPKIVTPALVTPARSGRDNYPPRKSPRNKKGKLSVSFEAEQPDSSFSQTPTDDEARDKTLTGKVTEYRSFIALKTDIAKLNNKLRGKRLEYVELEVPPTESLWHAVAYQYAASTGESTMSADQLRRDLRKWVYDQHMNSKCILKDYTGEGCKHKDPLDVVRTVTQSGNPDPCMVSLLSWFLEAEIVIFAAQRDFSVDIVSSKQLKLQLAYLGNKTFMPVCKQRSLDLTDENRVTRNTRQRAVNEQFVGNETFLKVEKEEPALTHTPKRGKKRAAHDEKVTDKRDGGNEQEAHTGTPKSKKGKKNTGDLDKLDQPTRKATTDEKNTHTEDVATSEEPPPNKQMKVSPHTAAMEHQESTQESPHGRNTAAAKQKPLPVVRCSICEEFYIKGQYKEHVKYHDKKENLQCEACLQIFDWRMQFKRHMDDNKCPMMKVFASSKK